MTLLRRGMPGLIATAVMSIAPALSAADSVAVDLVQLDPFAQATKGFEGCRPSSPPLVTPEQMRIIAHERVERGTRCALEGKCEPGGAYRRDPEINEQVRAAIARDKRFAGTSVSVTTTRKFVTLAGCVRSPSQRRALVALVKAQRGVERVLDETSVGTAGVKPATGAAR